MKIMEHIARQFKEVYWGRNWTWSNVKDALDDITLEEAKHEMYGLNTIAVLSFHLNYYVAGVSDFLVTGKLEINDKYAFTPPPLDTEEDWIALKDKIFADGERFGELLIKVDDDMLGQFFLEEKYTTYYRNFAGIIEHIHYHLGQIVIIKKIIRSPQYKMTKI